MWIRGAPALLLLALASCGGGGARSNQASAFPAPQRPVAPIVSSRYLNEDSRDSVGEFETVMRLAEIRERHVVADIGAGEGYYTVRLSPLVGREGPGARRGHRPGDDPGARPARHSASGSTMSRSSSASPTIRSCRTRSFDRIFMIHMYHEIERPSEFLWHMRAVLKSDGRVVVVDADRPTDRTAPRRACWSASSTRSATS